MSIRRNLTTFAAVVGLLGAVSLLPPDTSLQQVRNAGVLRVCLPDAYPPLVTAEPASPGIDVELLQSVAADLGLTLQKVINPAKGRDFNPRAWRITRAQCEILAGGVAATPTTSSFLDTTPPHAATGWAWLARSGPPRFKDARIGVQVGISGLDRVALAAWLRAQHAQVTVVAGKDQLLAGLRDGKFDAAVTERLQARGLAAQAQLTTGWMPDPLPRAPLVFGLWKGDLTLKRALVASLDRLRSDGRLARIVARYAPGSAEDP